MLVRFIIINLVNSVINGYNLVKLSLFWGKRSKLGHFVGQNDVIIKKFQGGKKIFFLKPVSKVILLGFISITVVKNVINGFNGVKMGHFKSKQLIFGENGQNCYILDVGHTAIAKLYSVFVYYAGVSMFVWEMFFPIVVGILCRLVF